MIGVDICSISKIKSIVEKNPNFLQRFFSLSEQAYLEQRNAKKWESMAAMFAAKEATLKAFGQGLGTVALCHISVEHLPSGMPYIELLGNAKEKLHFNGQIFLSISHEGDMAIAFVQRTLA